MNFAIVGCGNIGKRHLAVLDAEPRAELVAICDIDQNKVAQLSADYHNVPYYRDYKKLLSETDADILNVCTPHHLHAEMTIEIAGAGRHILVEKPMSISVGESEQMIKAARENSVHLFVVKQNRFNVPVRLVKEVIDSKKLGEIFMVKCDVLWNRYEGYYSESDWRGRKSTEGGALFTQASHFIDLMIWLFGDIKTAKAHIETKNHNIEIEDCGNAMLQLSSGVMATLTWTTCIYSKNYEGSITIIGEYGTIKIGGHYLNKIEYWDVRSCPLPQGIDFSDKPNHYGRYQGTSSNHDKVIKNVIAKLRNEEHAIVDGPEGLRTIRAIETIYSGT